LVGLTKMNLASLFWWYWSAMASPILHFFLVLRLFDSKYVLERSKYIDWVVPGLVCGGLVYYSAHSTEILLNFPDITAC
jgi:hypothetical protein